jgi:hypothetical protein
MISKEKIIKSIQEMPEDKFDNIDVLLERIILLQKIENGLSEVEEGNTISNEEMNQTIETWFKK